MIHWIESQSTSAITGIVFCACYIVAAAVLGIAVALSRGPIAEQLRTISPVTLTPLAVILGPAGFIFGLKALKQKKEMGESDGIIGIYLALLLGALEAVGAVVLLVAIFGAFNTHGHR